MLRELRHEIAAIERRVTALFEDRRTAPFAPPPSLATAPPPDMVEQDTLEAPRNGV